MSRMTKFLRQQCLLQPYLKNADGSPRHNDFGELQYSNGTRCMCRHEQLVRDVMTANGSMLRSSSRYFLDSSVDVRADYLIDGKVVLQVASYVNSIGQVEGYEVYT